MHKIRTLISFGAGYVLGSRAGRERYDQLARTFTKVKENPRVQEKAQQAVDLAKEAGPAVKEKVGSGGSHADQPGSARVGARTDGHFKPDPEAPGQTPLS